MRNGDIDGASYYLSDQRVSISIVSDEKRDKTCDDTNDEAAQEELCGTDTMRKALINTEKGLKDAVVMLKEDMIDIVSRIGDIELRLNQLPLECRNCHTNYYHKVGM